jgi:heptosyltransferase-2
MPAIPNRVLIIQTAFIGDVILATSLVESLHAVYPRMQIDLLCRKGNEGLLAGHPFLGKVWVWDKRGGKYKNWFALLKAVRTERYDLVVNLQRFATMGLFTALSGAKEKIGFSNAPFSFLLSKRLPHRIGDGTHEVERNLSLVQHLCPGKPLKPRLYPSQEAEQSITPYIKEPFMCIAPASVWFTKQFPVEKWIEFLAGCPFEGPIYLLGAPGDTAMAEAIMSGSGDERLQNHCGKWNLLQSAALMKHAAMNYVNDSAPMHLCSSMNAPVTAIFCSTVPEFGFGPLSDHSKIVQTKEKLDCRPCGLHGHKACPKGHFRCARGISSIK